MAVTYTSIDQCSAATGISPEIIRYAIKHPDAITNVNGCKYSNRLHGEKLQKWVADNRETIDIAIHDKSLANGVSLHDLEKIEKIRKLRNFNKSKDKAFISRKLVLDTLESITARLTDTLRQKFEYELPAKTAGLSEVEIKQINKKALDELLGNFKRAYIDWRTAEDVEEVSDADMEDED